MRTPPRCKSPKFMNAKLMDGLASEYHQEGTTNLSSRNSLHNNAWNSFDRRIVSSHARVNSSTLLAHCVSLARYTRQQNTGEVVFSENAKIDQKVRAST